MNMRKITSMTMFLSFLMLVLNSIVLYIVPHGRVAYWAEWKLWGLSKTDWANQHINFGFLFLAAGLLHVYYNWKPITAYMKNKAREMKVFTGAFNAALVLCILVGFGTYFMVPPLSTVIDFGESIKDAGSEKYGEPPYGHAELSSLKSFLKKTDLDPAKAEELLEKAGVKYDMKETFGSIAANHKMTPQQLFNLIKPAANVTEEQPFPDAPIPGFGRKKLGELCQAYGLDVDTIIKELTAKGFQAEPDLTVKDIASSADMDPHAFFEVLYEVVKSNQ
jgi:hypothetical protein